MFEKLKALFKKSPKEPKCEHDWVMEEPDFQFGNSYKEWWGPIYDYCTKCGERRLHPECEHRYEEVSDDVLDRLSMARKWCLKPSVRSVDVNVTSRWCQFLCSKLQVGEVASPFVLFAFCNIA